MHQPSEAIASPEAGDPEQSGREPQGGGALAQRRRAEPSQDAVEQMLILVVVGRDHDREGPPNVLDESPDLVIPEPLAQTNQPKDCPDQDDRGGHQMETPVTRRRR
jgi:hypothetical protein